MRNYRIGLLIIALSCGVLYGQDYYFPKKNESWQEIASERSGLDKELLAEAVAFAKENEYSGSRDLRIAILKGFEREPFHEILGPTKKRGGPAGLILYKGHKVRSWGETKRVDMTFRVTKSFQSTVAVLAFDKG